MLCWRVFVSFGGGGVGISSLRGEGRGKKEKHFGWDGDVQDPRVGCLDVFFNQSMSSSSQHSRGRKRHMSISALRKTPPNILPYTLLNLPIRVENIQISHFYPIPTYPTTPTPLHPPLCAPHTPPSRPESPVRRSPKSTKGIFATQHVFQPRDQSSSLPPLPPRKESKSLSSRRTASIQAQLRTKTRDK